MVLLIVWNSLPGALKVLSCQHVFKKNYKMYVLNGNAPISISESMQQLVRFIPYYKYMLFSY